jgi:hypothetical protein
MQKKMYFSWQDFMQPLKHKHATTMKSNEEMTMLVMMIRNGHVIVEFSNHIQALLP